MKEKNENLQSENRELKNKIQELEDTLNAIRTGDVDAIVLDTEKGEQIFSLSSTDTSYRVFIEQMTEGAAILSEKGLVFYCNKTFAEIFNTPIKSIQGNTLDSFFNSSQKKQFHSLIKKGFAETVKQEFTISGAFNEKNLEHSFLFVAAPFINDYSEDSSSIEATKSISLIAYNITSLKVLENQLKEHKKNLEKKVEEQTLELSASNQQLRASNQQLQAGEQQLRATNLQLIEESNKLKSSEEELNTIFNTAADGMRMVGADFKIKKVNDTFCKMVGLSRDEIIGKNCYDIFWGEHCDKDDCPIKKLPKHTKNSIEIEITKTRPDGKDIPTIKTSTRLENNQGDFVGIVEDFKDITERKHAEANLHAAFQQLQASEQQLRASNQQLSASEQQLRASETSVRRKLTAITEPDGDLSKLELSDILDTATLQSLMENLTGLTGMCSGIADLKGNVLASVGWRDVCKNFHRAHPEAKKNCIESDTILSSGIAPGEFKLYRCKNHMWEAASPITIAGQHMGNVFFGQFFYDDEELDEIVFSKQAKRFNFDKQEYLTALNAVPRYSRKEADCAIRFFAEFSRMISAQSYSNLVLSRSLSERKRTEEILQSSNQQLQASEQQLRASNQQLIAGEKALAKEKIFSEKIVETANAIIVGLDKDHIIKIFNQGAEHITGYKKEEVIGKDWFKIFFPKELLDEMNKVWKEAWGDKSHSYINPILAKSGEERVISWQTTGMYDGDDVSEHLQLLIGEDITERKQAEEELLETRERLQFALEGSQQGMWDWTIPSGEVIYNDLWANLLGYKPTEVEPRVDFFLSHVHPKDLETVKKRLQLHLDQKAPIYESEHRMLSKDGEEIWTLDRGKITERDHDGKPLRVTGLITDISKVKEGEKKLKESEERFRNVFNLSQSMICIADINTATFKLVNPAFTGILGYTEKELLSKSFLDFVHPDDKEPTIKIIEKEMKAGKKVFHFTNRYRCKDNSYKWLDWSSHNETGKGISYSVANDITELKEVELKLQANERILEEAQKIAHLGSFEYVAATQTTIWSEEEYRIYGLDPNGPSPEYNEMVEKFIHPDDAKLLHETFMMAIKNQGLYELEHRIVRPDGSIRWVHDKAHPYFDEKGNLLRYVGATLDITERKQFIKTIQERNEYIESVMENMPIGFALNTIDNGDVKYMNDRFEEIYGWPRDILTNTSIFFEKVFPEPEYREKMQAQIVADMQSGDPERMRWNNLKIVTSTGDVRYVYGHNIPLPDQNLMISTVQDITMRKLAEEALKVSEAKFRSYVDYAPDGIFVADEKGKYLKVNQAACDITGYSKKELLQKSIPELLHKSEVEKGIQHFNEVQEKGFAKNDIGFVTKSGEHRFWNVSAVKLSDTRFLGFAKDITERKIAEEKLIERERMLNEVGEIAKIGGWEMDLENGGKATWTKATYDIIGVELGEPIPGADEHVSWYLPEYQDMVRKKMQDLIEMLLPMQFEAQFISKKGDLKWCLAMGEVVEENGKVVKLRGTFQDITERKKAEQIIASRQKEFQTWIQNTPVCTKKIDLDFNLQYMSEAGIRELKVDDVNKLYGAPYPFNFFPADFQKQMLDMMNQVKKTCEIKQIDGILSDTEGTEMWYNHIIVPVKNHEEELDYLLIISSDISERKKAEEKIRENEKKFRLLTENSIDCIWRMDLKLNFTYISPSVQSMFGYTQKEWIGTSLASHATRREFMKMAREALKGIKSYKTFKHVTFEAEMLHKNGSTIPIEISGKLIKNKKGFPIGLQGSTRNITERKKAEENILKAKKEAEDSELLLRTLINAVPDLIWLKDKNGTYLNCNKRFEDFFGHSESKIVGKTDYDFVDKELADFFRHHDKVAMNAGKPSINEEEITFAVDGHSEILETIKTPLVDKSNKVIGVLGVGRDITERKKANDLIKLNEMHLSSLVENPAGYIVYRTRLNRDTGKIEVIKVSPDFSKVLGIPETDKENFQHWFANVYPDDLPKLMNANEEGMKPPFDLHIEIRHKHPEKGIQWLDIRAKGIPYADNPEMIEYANGMILNITERKKTETELVIAKEKAEESDRLKSAFLANMSHEIRTPMNGILGFTNLLKNPQLEGDKKEEYIQVIEKSGERMLNTINDIIDISKIEAGQVIVTKTAVLVNSILKEQYNFFHREATKKGLELNYKPSLTNKESLIITDKNKLEGILINLIKNAIKYTEAGSITFGCAIKNLNGKEFCEFYVQDTGLGIPENRLHAIFNRFEQADIEDLQVFEGSGLGLAISKSYVEMLGGTIDVSSQEGLGSTFTFSIPYVKQALKENESEQYKEEESEVSLENLSVIVAEDDETSRMLFDEIFQNTFKKIIYTTTGVETIDKCQETSDIGIILMDIKMPDMNGYNATREVRKFNKDVIIIAQTAYSMSRDKKKALEAGCNDYISKPINKELLFEKIRGCLDKKTFNRIGG